MDAISIMSLNRVVTQGYFEEVTTQWMRNSAMRKIRTHVPSKGNNKHKNPGVEKNLAGLRNRKDPMQLNREIGVGGSKRGRQGLGRRGPLEGSSVWVLVQVH